MLRVMTLGLAAVFAIATSMSSATISAETTPSKCELHIWPTKQFAVTENLGGSNLGLVGALIDEATRLKSPEGITTQLSSQLSPAEQGRILRDVKFNVLLSLSDYEVILEPSENQPVWTLAQMTSADRLFRNAPLCYAELAIISNQYLKQAVGSRLRTFVRYREYNSKGELRANLLDATATKADQFPASKSDGISASAKSVQDAFRDNLLKLQRKLKR